MRTRPLAQAVFEVNVYEPPNSFIPWVLTPFPTRVTAESFIMVTYAPERQSTAETPVSERDTLFRDFQPLVRRLVNQYGCTPELRKDLAGEIYNRFHELLCLFDPTRGVPLRPYLVRQLSAFVYSYARREWTIRRRETLFDEATVNYRSTATVPPMSDSDLRMDLDLLLESLPAAIERLPKRQRRVLILRYYDQQSFDSIALELQIAPATARSLLRHACNNLRIKLRAG